VSFGGIHRRLDRIEAVVGPTAVQFDDRTLTIRELEELKRLLRAVPVAPDAVVTQADLARLSDRAVAGRITELCAMSIRRGTVQEPATKPKGA
jgi:hypothetical protein